MALVLETADGPVKIPDSVISAIERHAEFHAELVVASLDLMGFAPSDRQAAPVRFPAAFLLELAAIAQLQLWELAGVGELLAADLPTYAEAVADLHERVTSDPSQFNAAGMPKLARLVAHIWRERLGWDARSILQAEVVVGEVDEEALVEALAQLLWAHRHDQSRGG